MIKMKFQWNSMTDFARGLLKKMGAVPVSDLHEAYREVGRLTIELNNVSYKNANSFPYLIEPTTLISYDTVYDQQRFQMKTRNLHYFIDRHMVDSMDYKEYKRFLICHLSRKWAEQTEEVLEEMMEQQK